MKQNTLIKKLTYIKVLLQTLLYFVYINLLDFLLLLILESIDKIEIYQPIQGIIYIPLLIIFFPKNLNLNSFKNIHFKKLFIYSVLIIIAFRITEDPFFRMKEILSLEPMQKIIQIEESPSILFLFFTILLIPIVEELFFRRYLYNYLKKKNVRKVFSIIITSILFSMIHPTFPSLILSFFWGIILCTIYANTGSILFSITLHVGYNFFWATISYFSKEYWLLIQSLNFNYLYWAVFAVALFFTIKLTSLASKIRLRT